MAADLACRAFLGACALRVCYGDDRAAFDADAALGCPRLDAFPMTARLGRDEVEACVRVHLGELPGLDEAEGAGRLGRLLARLPRFAFDPLLRAFAAGLLDRHGTALADRAGRDPVVKALVAGYQEAAAARRGTYASPLAALVTELRAQAARRLGGWRRTAGLAASVLAKLWRLAEGSEAEIRAFAAAATGSRLSGHALLGARLGRRRPAPLEPLPPVEPLPRQIWQARRRLAAERDRLQDLATTCSDAGRRLASGRVRLAHLILGGADRVLAGAGARASRSWIAPAVALFAALAAVGCATPEVVAERCNGLDDDGDGVIDEGTTKRFFADRDGDGFGDPDDGINACLRPDGFVDDGTDCDDEDNLTFPAAPEGCTDAVDRDCDGHAPFEDGDGDGIASCQDCDDDDAAVSPLAEEVCNGVDDDCDGQVDEDGTPVTWFLDDDGDGYGQEWTSCRPPEGTLVEVGGDCDDTDARRNPGEVEVCDDGIDNDCDGVRSFCKLEGEIDLLAADAVIVGEAENDRAGSRLAGGDFDGDGIGDLVIGVPVSDRGGEDCGTVFLVHGPVTGTVYLEDADHVIEPEAGTCDGLGLRLGAGDVDMDGYADLLISERTERLAWIRGPPGAVGTLDRADLLIDKETKSTGEILHVARDLDGDGMGEILLSDGLKVRAVWEPAPGVMSSDDLDVLHEMDDCRALTSFDGTADFDGDGLADLAVYGYCNSTSYHQVHLTSLAGRTRSAAITGYGVDTVIFLSTTPASSGEVATIDVDGDGNPELLAGDGFSGDSYAGYIASFEAPLSGTYYKEDAEALITGSWEPHCGLAEELAVGDLDGDGLGDLVALSQDSVCDDVGSAGIFYASDWAPRQMYGSAGALLGGAGSDQYTPTAVALADLDGDGIDDLGAGLVPGDRAFPARRCRVFVPRPGTMTDQDTAREEARINGRRMQYRQQSKARLSP